LSQCELGGANGLYITWFDPTWPTSYLDNTLFFQLFNGCKFAFGNNPHFCNWDLAYRM
jgi:hypothetical protein